MLFTDRYYSILLFQYVSYGLGNQHAHQRPPTFGGAPNAVVSPAVLSAPKDGSSNPPRYRASLYRSQVPNAYSRLISEIAPVQSPLLPPCGPIATGTWRPRHGPRSSPDTRWLDLRGQGHASTGCSSFRITPHVTPLLTSPPDSSADLNSKEAGNGCQGNDFLPLLPVGRRQTRRPSSP